MNKESTKGGGNGGGSVWNKLMGSGKKAQSGNTQATSGQGAYERGRENYSGAGEHDSEMDRLRREVLTFPTNVDLLGAGRLAEQIKDKHELRIVGVLVGNDFDDWGSVGSKEIDALTKLMPRPSDFRINATNFIHDLGVQGGNEQANRQRRAEYMGAMESVYEKIYGMRARAEELMEDAYAAGREGASRRETQKKMGGYAGAAVAGHGNVARQSSVAVSTGNVATRSSVAVEKQSVKNERRGEVLDERLVGVVSVGKNQKNAFQNAVNSARDRKRKIEYTTDARCEDSYFVNPDKQIYAVFDGAGGEKGAREAAQLAQRELTKIVDEGDFGNSYDLMNALNRISEKMRDDQDAGISTGVLTKMVKDPETGRDILYWASIGDSRIYVEYNNGQIVQLSKDESVGNMVWNALGHFDPNSRGDGPGHVVDDSDHHGAIHVNPGNRIILVSDGVTGDYPEQAIDDKIGPVVALARNPRKAAEDLVAISKKPDDTTAIVVEVA